MMPIATNREYFRMYLDRFMQWLAWKLPRNLVMWTTIRVIANATQGKYSATIVTDLTAMDALDRWEHPQFDGPNKL